MYMVGRYVKLTVSLMQVIIMDRLSFREAYRKYISPDQQIYLAALHRALDIEGTALYRMDQNTRPERSEKSSLLQPPEDRSQQIL